MIISSKKSAQGIGTLIIFIALILVAAIAATVIVQTSSSLQSRSLDVGKETESKILSRVEIVDVYAEDASDGELNQNDSFTVGLKLGSGGEPVDLEKMIIKLDTGTFSQSFVFTNSTSTETSFNLTYVSNNGNSTVKNYLTKKDIVEIPLLLNGDIERLDKVKLRFVTEMGADSSVYFSIPGTFISKRILLYP